MSGSRGKITFAITPRSVNYKCVIRGKDMEYIHILAVVYYGIGICFLIYEFIDKRREKKRLAKALDNLSKSLSDKNPR